MGGGSGESRLSVQSARIRLRPRNRTGENATAKAMNRAAVAQLPPTIINSRSNTYPAIPPTDVAPRAEEGSRRSNDTSMVRG